MTIKSNNSARRTIILMFVITLLPVLIALLLYLNPQWISRYKNYGNLIQPPVQFKKNELTPADEFSISNFSELDNRWILIHLIPRQEQDCDQQCETAIYQSHQLWLMLNQNLMRIRRLALYHSIEQVEKLKSNLDDQYLLHALGSDSLFQRVNQRLPQPLKAGTVVICDPLGNLMLWYTPDFDPYKVKKDLTQLFKSSRIG
ncbi:MAG: hypothetical protein K0U68_15150 [Gammaproteobacteria bacterium]|nr:hypothetical protein [Gammaproteobacteria bacterium]